MNEKVRNAAILIYMVGNALTFSRLWGTELAGLREAGELGSALIKALLVSAIWPIYWIGRLLFG